MLLFIPYLSGQTQKAYADVRKTTFKDTLTLNIVTESKKQLVANEKMQAQLVKAVDNQSSLNQVVGNAISALNTGLSSFTKQIEERNKNDSRLITDVFNYSPERVRKVIKIERWLNFITILFAWFFIAWSFTGESLSVRYTADTAIVKLIFALSLTVAFSYLFLKLITLLFNGDYYVIKELITLYT